jgi:hypothetical protein
LAGNVAFYTWPSLGCPSGIGWREELVAVVGRPTTAVPRGKGRFAFVGMFPHIVASDLLPFHLIILAVDSVIYKVMNKYENRWCYREVSSFLSAINRHEGHAMFQAVICLSLTAEVWI